MRVFISPNGYKLETANEKVIEMMVKSGYREITPDHQEETSEKATKKRSKATK